MQIYSAKIRLGGLLHTEVRLDSLTAAEILVLRAIHAVPPDDGSGSVVEIKETLNGEGEKIDQKRSSKAERFRLIAKYGEEKYRAVFPTDFAALPQTLVEVDESDDEEEAEMDSEVVPVDVQIKKSPTGFQVIQANQAARKAAKESAEEALA
jgi:hypothetical protein